MRAFSHLVRRDLALAWKEGGADRRRARLLSAGGDAACRWPSGPDLNLLARIAPGILWLALLLAALLSLGRMFEADMEDGSLEVLATGPLPFEAIAAAKSLAHWLTTGVPLTVLAPLLGLLLNLELEAYGILVATMLAGTPAISFLGAVGAALTLKARRGGLLMGLLMLPLFVPTLIFGISAHRHRGRRGSLAVVPDPGSHLAGRAGPWTGGRGRGPAAPAAVADPRTYAFGRRFAHFSDWHYIQTMATLTQRLANPTRFMELSARLLPWIAAPGRRADRDRPRTCRSPHRPTTSRAKRPRSCSCTCRAPGCPCSSTR